LQIQISDSIAKYLGMPTTMGRSKMQNFNFIMDKVWSKLKGWKERHLSFAGRSVLISAVIQAIPTYMMSCFLIPKTIYSQIERAICKFWWGSKEGAHKIHWKAKTDLFKPKFSGGLGFRDMHTFNLAMLAKQGWRLHVYPNSLISQCLKAKYYPSSDVLNAPVGNSPSFTWKSIHHALWILNKGCCWKIGSGTKVNIWNDNWLPQQNGYKILTPKDNHSPTLVSDLIKKQPIIDWDSNVINNTFLPFEGSLIKQLPLTQESLEDQLMWPHTKDGYYSVRSGYNIINHWQDRVNCGTANANPHNLTWKKLWNIPTIPRHKAFLWRLINHSIPVRSALSHKGVPCPIVCPRCLTKEETIDHLFRDCDRARRVWFGCALGINFSSIQGSFTDWLLYCISSLKMEDLSHLSAIVYGIWFARNKLVFDNKDTDDKDIIEKALTSTMDYQKANLNPNKQENGNNIKNNSNNNHNQ
jgi:hypothetical protein